MELEANLAVRGPVQRDRSASGVELIDGFAHRFLFLLELVIPNDFNERNLALFHGRTLYEPFLIAVKPTLNLQVVLEFDQERIRIERQNEDRRLVKPLPHPPHKSRDPLPLREELFAIVAAGHDEKLPGFVENLATHDIPAVPPQLRYPTHTT